MMVDVCRRCPKWTEFVSLTGEGGILMACGCLRFNIICDDVFGDGVKAACVVESMRRHGRKRLATHYGKAFWKIVGESLGEEHERAMGKLSMTDVPEGCPYYVEHMVAKWNGSMQ
jgi:hypothetical protein